MAQKLNEFFSRLSMSSKNFGTGTSLLFAAGALIYGGSQSLFTGK